MNDLKIQVKYTTTNINGVLTENCTYLDLYEFDIPKITISIEDIVSTNLKTPYTNTFRVPNSNTNAQFFRDVFDINGIDFDVTKVVDCYIIVDDNIFTFGELRLNKVYEYELENRVDYEVVFIGRLRNFVSRLGDKNLNDLDWEGWTYPLDYTTITDSWSAYPQTANGGIIVGDGDAGDVIFPLVDFGNDLVDGEIVSPNTSLSIFNPNNIPYDGMPQFTDNTLDTSLLPNKFRPMVRVKKVFDKIMEEAGFTYESEFMNSDLLKNLYISNWGNEDKAILLSNYLRYRKFIFNSYTYNLIPPALIVNAGNNPFYDRDIGGFEYQVFNLFANKYLNGDDIEQYNYILDEPTSLIIDSDFANGQENSYYLVLEDGEYQIKFDVPHRITTKFIFGIPLGFSYIQGGFEVKKIDADNNESILDSYSYTSDDLQSDNYPFIAFGSNIQTIVLSLDTTHQLNAGDKIYIEFYSRVEPPLITNTWFITDIEYGDYTDDMNIYIRNTDSIVTQIDGNFENEYKQIDFIKDIATKFRLVFDEDKTQPNKFKIEPFNNYVGTGQSGIEDWTDKLDLSKAQEIEPIFYSQKKLINFVDNKNNDYLSRLYNDDFDKEYGTLEVYYDNDLLIGERDVKAPKMVSIPNTQIRGLDVSNTSGSTFIYPIIANENSDGITEPIKPKTAILFYNGRVDTGSELLWSMKESASEFTNFSKYPLISQWSQYPTTGTTLWLNWSKEFPFNRSLSSNSINSFQQGQTVHDRYWKDYIEYLYDKDSRIYTAYFKLNAFDLFTFNFSKIIQVKSNFYYVNKIENMPLTGDNVVKVELIKLNGFTPPYQIAPPIVGQVWNTTDQVWNTTDNTWDD